MNISDSLRAFFAGQVVGKLRSSKRQRPSRSYGEPLESRLVLAAFTVTVADDSGPGSLRAAIVAANNNPGPDQIDFQIPGSGVQTISLLSPLPEINDPLELDGRSQPGYAGMPLIELDGSSAGSLADGLVITASGSSVHGLVVNRFDGSGIVLDGASSNSIHATFVGVDATGLSAAGNGRNGIELTNGAADNLIGGLTVADRNVIGGHSDTSFAGVFLIGAGTENNTVAGNLIGLGIDGQTIVGNFYGVRVENASGVNTVGGDVAEARNVISGNVVGAWVANSPGTSVSGNYIGTDVSGLLARGNTNSGVQLIGSAGTLGGPTLAHGNLITGTTGNAHVSLNNSGSGVVIQNNWMGTDATGSAILGPRVQYGIGFNPGAFGSVQILENTIAHVSNGIVTNPAQGSHVVRGNRIGTSVDGNIALPVTFGIGLSSDDNFIGGTTTEHRNIIVADNTAVIVSGDDNEITGNWIGVYGDGLIASPSSVGIQMQDGAARTLIGGFTSTPGTGAGNVIAGTTFRGIQLTSSSGNETRVRGNIIGLAADGVTDVTIGGEGIRVTGGLNAIIGGDDAADGTIDGVIQARNIISGFGAGNQAGIGFSTSGSNLGTRIQGNYIGTDITGTLGRGNYNGIAVGNGPGTVIGGTTSGAGNVISGSSQQGVVVNVNGASTIQGNIIGLNAAGNSPLPNSWGILVSTSGNLIGGDTPGARNVISGNTRGVDISSVTATNNVVQGNYIGTDVTGLVAVGNSQIGVQVHVGATNNTIGGSTALPGTGRGNVIAGNTDDGVRLDSDNNFVYGNLIGLGSDGSTMLPNSDGVEVRNGNANTIGGPTLDLRNVISGNQFRGITVNTDRLNNVIQGNFVGTDRSGLQGRGNGGVGVQLNNSLSTVVGGPTATPGTGAGNVISGNLGSGIQLGGNSDNAVVQGNLIGLGVDGSTQIGNGGFAGVYIFGATGAGDIQIGGDDGLSGNVISANSAGIIVRDTSIDVNIEGNRIGTDVTGTLRRGNLSTGIAVQEQLTNPVVIGGSTPQTRNLISANDFGISIESGSTNVDVLGNFIGTTLTGTAALGNRIGVRLANSAFENVIGGSDPTQRNLISGNSEIGLQLDGSDNVVQGNAFGTGVSETQAVGGGTGIVLVAGSNNQIGGLAENEANVIAYQQVAGLRLLGNTGSQNNLQRNRYLANLGPGIDAGPAGLTLNDPGDLDNAPNYPVMTRAVAENGELTIEGFADAGISFDLFLSSPSSSGFGQGAQYLGSFVEGAADDLDSTSGNYGPLLGGQAVSTGSIAAERFRFVLPVTIDVVDGDLLTIVRTGSMSEFSPALIVGQQLSRLAPTIALDESSVTLVASERLQVAGSFDDPDSTSWTATVDFGDGSGPQPLSLSADRSFLLSHHFPAAGSYAVSVEITDNSLMTGVTTFQVTVENEAPVITFNEFTYTNVVQEGQLASLAGKFEDLSGLHSVDVDWGDGTVSTIAVNPGDRTFLATHIYEDDGDAAGPQTPVDVYRVRVSVTDDGGASAQTQLGLFLIEVVNVRPHAIVADLSSTTITEGSEVTISTLSFVDPGQADIHQVVIDWGDGTRRSISLPTGVRSFSGLPEMTHIYANNPATGSGPYVVTIEVSDDDEPFQPAILTRSIEVTNAVPDGLQLNLSAATIVEGETVSLSGMFTDPGLRDRHRVIIDWGDGTPELALDLAPAVQSFSGITHTYRNNPIGGGDYTITVRVSDQDQPALQATATTTVSVLNAAPVLGALLTSHGGTSLTEGDVIVISGSFSDLSSVDRHTVWINWGDGSSPRQASVNSTTRTFTATHRYADDSSLITVTVQDEDGGTDTGTLTQQVLNVAPTVTFSPDSANVNPDLITLNAGITDPGSLDTFAFQWTAVPLVSGTPVAQTGSGNSSFTVDRSSHPTALWRVVLTVTDDDGGVGVRETVVLVGTSSNDALVIDDNTFLGAGTSSIMVLGLGGSDIIDGTNVSDPAHALVMDGGTGVDFLFGGAGDDVYFLRNGDDNANVLVSGGPVSAVFGGNDRYMMMPNSTLTVIDPEGANILDFSLADFGTGTGITFNLSLVESASPILQDVAPDSDPGMHFVNVQGTFSELVGSRFGDTLTVSSDSVVRGVAGSNQYFVNGFTNNASIVGGADDDLLTIHGMNISNLSFFGDDGLNAIHNFGALSSLIFSGGADDDLLINFAGAAINTISFAGDSGFNRLENLGTIAGLTFSGGADDDLLINHPASLISQLVFQGDDGWNQVQNLGQISELTFAGGADQDILLNQAGATISSLSFSGDDGIDELQNFGTILSLSFVGGADDDLLLNQFGAQIGLLTFTGDDGFNFLQNLGTVTTLTFGGGADDDLLINQSSGQIQTLFFNGDDGFDELRNHGDVAALTFVGGADDDLLVNLSGGLINNLSFQGDEGLNQLQNLGRILDLSFSGGADDDVLINAAAAEIGLLSFSGDDGWNRLQNAGTITELTFTGGADADSLVNQAGAVIATLNFTGDSGSNQLRNLGQITDLAFTGGADDDLLVNFPGATVSTLSFFGDAGSNQLLNAATIMVLTFTGGADDDLLQNEMAGTIFTLTFTGDDGSNLLNNLGTVSTLTFHGGADDDVLFNGPTALVSSLVFNGDDGFNLLRNAGAVADLTFTGGADDDQLVNLSTATVASISFFGDSGANLLLNLGSGISQISFTGGADDDVLWNEGHDLTRLIFVGDDGQNLLFNTGSSIREIVFTGGADDDVLISDGRFMGTLSFSGDVGSDTLVTRGSGDGTVSSWIAFDGGDGIDAFRNDADLFHRITFTGGADNDVLVNNGSQIFELSFQGDGGDDLLENNGFFISSLVFNGDSGRDVLVNDGDELLVLTFLGGADDDVLINNGHLVQTLVFQGGADDDLLFNQGSQVVSLTFIGDTGVDSLINAGALLGSLTFHGGADDDLLWNRDTGVLITSLVFNGDDGNDLLINDAADLASLVFNGGADDDVLRNNGSFLGEIIFQGDDGFDVLVNTAAAVQQLTFFGGADDDVLIQRGDSVVSLEFTGDDGADVLGNFGSTQSVLFSGGADDDLLLNSGGTIQQLTFSGDDGRDILVNNGVLWNMTFHGGADDDILQNNGSVTGLVFFGDDGNDTLINNFAVSNLLTFEGGADNDTLINNASAVTAIIFQGDAGNDTARINGRDLGDVSFYGGDGTDTLIWNGEGISSNVVTFHGGDGSDFLAHRGTVGTLLFSGGEGDDRALILGDGNLSLTGGAGNDYYQFGPDPSGTVSIGEDYALIGDDSADTLDFSSYIASAIQLDLRTTAPQSLSSDLVVTLTNGLGIENLVGTQYSDVLFGNARNNRISGAQFTEAQTGAVAARRTETQWVFLDFDSDTSPGEHVYTAEQRETIRAQIELAYRGPNVAEPWFDVRVALSETEIPAQYAADGHYVTIFFNSTPSFGRPGGLASEIDPGNFNLGGTAQVQINGMLGGVIQATGDGYEHGNPEEDSDRQLLKGVISPAVRDDEIGALKPAATAENFVVLSVKVAAHELAHLLGLRHHDAFGPLGMGIHDPPGSGSFRPAYGGPAGGFETFNHLIGSPASVGSTRFDDLKGLYFGEREAIKLAYAFADRAATTATVIDADNHTLQNAFALPLVNVNVPNTLLRGLNQSMDFSVQMYSVQGQISLDSLNGRSRSDWYSFEGVEGDLINIDVFSNSIRRFATGPNGELLADDFVDTIVRVYDASGSLVRYYGGDAVNDDLFEPTDSTLVDLILPADGIYYIEVDTFHRFGDSLGDTGNPLSPLNPTNPDNILELPDDVLKRIRDSFDDTDNGNYQLIIYRFARSNSESAVDEIRGFGGTDQIDGGPGTDFRLNYDLGSPVEVEIDTVFHRTIVLHDPAASDWASSTVDYGDGSGLQTLTVTASGQFTLQRTWSAAGQYMVSVAITNDIGQTEIRMLAVTVTEPVNTAPVVQVSGPFQSVRGETGFYVFSASDADAEDAESGFTYFVDWGDGSPIQQVTGGLSIELMHSFVNAGSYHISVVVQDARGASSAASLLTVMIETVLVRPDLLNPGENVLLVGGTSGHDVIFISGTSGDEWLLVHINGEVTAVRWKQNGVFLIHAVAVYGQDGHDILTMHPNLSLPVLLDGGAGNDLLTGGQGENILIGGDGNDMLIGFGGRDLLIGGRGRDLLYGGTGEDILIAGFTQHDQDRRALDALMREWTRSGNLASRRNRLMGNTPGGYNGQWFLRPSGSQATVFDDNELDVLWGGAGRDWFLFNMNAAEGSQRDFALDVRNSDEDDDIDLFSDSQ